jgi:hypothetical protein
MMPLYVLQRERERYTDTQTHRQREREGGREREIYGLISCRRFVEGGKKR